HVLADLRPHVVPFETGGLAGFAADTLRDIDELGYRRELSRRRRDLRRRPSDQILFAQIWFDVLGRRGRKDKLQRHPSLLTPPARSGARYRPETPCTRASRYWRRRHRASANSARILFAPRR